LKTIVESGLKKTWSQEIWEKSSRIYNAILKLDFLKDLSEGTLANEIFARYIAQDELYLKNYYHQMNMLAEMMDDDHDRDLFLSFAQSGMEGEAAMHELLIDKYGIDTQVDASKVTADYNAHICEGISTGNTCIALAAVLPCMWIYNRVGLHILNHSTLEGNQYKEWILEYGQEEFTVGVNQVLKMIDALAADADDETRQMMDYYYLKSALYEYAFWDYGYYGDSKSYDYTESLEEWL
jgi:thiaminase/transcriptional activator TenA